MSGKISIKKYIPLVSTCLLFFLVLAVWLFAPSYSNTMSSSAWDGTVSLSFPSGNGSELNPYAIESGSDLAYLKQLLEGPEDITYLDKYYAINSDINLGDNEFYINNINPFVGSIDGKANVISNGIIVDSLFSSIENSTIKNLNFNNVTLRNDADDVSALIAKSSSNSLIQNVTILMNVEVVSANYISALLGIDDGSVLENIIINGAFGELNTNVSYLVNTATETSITNVLIKNEVVSTLFISDQDTTSDNILFFQIANAQIVIDNSDIFVVLSEFFDDEEYNFTIDENIIKFSAKQHFAPMNLSLFGIASVPSYVFTLHSSGIVGNTLYVNDLESDYNYYQGLNFVQSSNGAIPSGVNQNIYNSSNLVRVQIIYSGIEQLTNKTNIGRISLTEPQTEIVYYKYYPVVNNKVQIDLIDNPFVNRPNDMGFNNWVLDGEGTVYFDHKVYKRSVEVDITRTGGIPDDLVLSFHASWIPAKTADINSASAWTNAFNTFDAKQLIGFPTIETVCSNMGGYYRIATAAYNARYTGYNVNGVYQNNVRCTSTSGCTYYVLIVSGELYSSGNTYYELYSGTMRLLDLVGLGLGCNQVTKDEYVGQSMAGFYVEVSVPRYGSIVGYYNSSGVYQSSGTCSTTSGCTYYELLQNYDSLGNQPIFSFGTSYYFMATRDTNIAYLTATFNNSPWTSTHTKPFTLTGIHNGVDYRNNVWTINSSYIRLYADTTMEYLSISSSQTNNVTNVVSSATSTRYIFGNYNNLKIGRGMLRVTSGVNRYTNFSGIVGGLTGTSGSSSTPNRYHVIVESGFYNTITLTHMYSGTSDVYVDMDAIYGSDYDRITGNNSSLDVYFVAAGSWGGSIRHSDRNHQAIRLTTKSGSFGTGKEDHTCGIYVGGRGAGNHYIAKSVKVEGGYIYNLIGGPTSNDASGTTRRELNDVYMYIAGGEIDAVFGGAGTSATYGNRIISLTGGRVNYSVFGGSNSHDGATTDGTLNGTTFVYAGGNATVGNRTLVNNGTLLTGAEAGSIFGVGNGRSGSTYNKLGSCDNSNIVVDGNATILGNVYGGGNYGGAGITTSKSTTTTNIKVLGGQIEGDIYGAGNRNGAGDTAKISTITIDINGGLINGNVYGGSNISGIVYGSVGINVLGGQIDSNVYGGGKGGTAVSNMVSRNVNVIIGNSVSGPTITGSVHGGSAFGTVNGTVNNTTVSSYSTNVTVNNGIISDSVFGGGEGNTTYNAYVLGHITVNVNGGNIGYVYGGNDQAGIPNGNVLVYLNGGVIGEAYGGGNRSSVRTTQIYLQGATVTNLFGGSNTSGTVNNGNVTVSSGNATNVFGGNNVGGTLDVARVNINGGTVNGVYGGGNLVATTTTHLYLNDSSSPIPYAFGGGKSANVNVSNVYKYNAVVNSIFGGSDTSGVVYRAYVNYYSGNATNVFGGNNVGGQTMDSTINVTTGTINNLYGGGYLATSGNNTTNINGGTITNVYGGGNEAGISSSIINMNSGNITNLFGGSNTSGTTATTTIRIYNGTINKVYGGNNLGGQTTNPKITVTDGNIGNIYGGGNAAVTSRTDVEINGGNISTVYGGGNEASVLESTKVTINGGNISGNVFGGGNFGTVTYNAVVLVQDATILGSIHGGGNGLSATVYGNTNISIAGNAVVGDVSSVAPVSGSVFGGGNAATTGTSLGNNSLATVNISGGSIYGSVYGGANTSVVYGTTDLNIGTNAVSTAGLKKGDIYIRGTIFGGGEANASGSEIYDYSFISVTNGIAVDIDGSGHTSFSISGSIFGSGNASSTQGTSAITIKNYGTLNNPQKNISIQRTNLLTIDNSSILLSGASDRTNEYSDVLFTLSIIDVLRIKNNSNLYLGTGTNLLRRWESVTSGGAYQTVTINNGVVSKNVDNRVYMFEGRNLNIATNENVTSYGEVYGMTFFGMFTYDRYGNPNMGIYHPQFGNGDPLDWGDMPNKGSYVLGLHKVNHNINVDGFYSHFMNEDTSTNMVEIIRPTPEDSNFFMWVIGEAVIEYNIDLVASKYATLGMVELPFLEFAKPNTTFQVLGFDDGGLAPGMSLIDGTTVPRVASSSAVANSVMGLSMKSSISGWLTKGETRFLSSNPKVQGTTTYIGENSTAIPSLIFYLYHSKNLTVNGDLGTVQITIMATTKLDALNNEAKRLLINVNLSSAVYQTNEYEGTMTAGREYGMFSSSVVNITSKSALSAYFSLFVVGNSIYNVGYHRSLVSSYVLPLGTKMTMIDFAEGNPVYYYHVIDATDVVTAQSEYALYGECSYNLSLFVKMGSVNSNMNYDDDAMNNIYYSSSLNITDEAFVFIVDFEDTNITSDVLNSSLLIELRDGNDRTIYSVLGIQHQSLTYNIYANRDAVIDVVANISTNTIYAGHSADLSIDTNFVSNRVGGNTVHDTSFFDTKLGIKFSILDGNGEVMSGTSLLGVSFVMDNVRYYPNLDGTTRIKISDRVGNVSTWMKLDMSNTTLPTGHYTLKIESFNSPDGIYYGHTSSDTELISLYIINDIYGLDAAIAEHSVIFDALTGRNQIDTNKLDYTIKYSSGLTNPNIRLKLYRRKYDTLYDTSYEEVDLRDYVTNILTTTTNENEFLILGTPLSNNVMEYTMKPNLLTGTYRLDYSLYDGSVFIGTISRYIIIK